jgi:hypothetical protein
MSNSALSTLPKGSGPNGGDHSEMFLWTFYNLELKKSGIDGIHAFS